MRGLVLLLVLPASGLFGYVRLDLCQFTNGACPAAPLQRTDAGGIQFYLNNLIAPGFASSASGSNVTVIGSRSNPQQAIALAKGAWDGVTTASVTFLPVQNTTKTHDASDCVNVIAVAASPSELSAVAGVIAITINSTVTSSGRFQCDTGATIPNVNAGNIVDSDILLNPQYSFSTDGSTSVDMQAVLTHEFGHVLSANHSQMLGATMFQYSSPSQRFLSTDDLAFVNSAYPASGSAAASLGTISGTVTANGSGVPYAPLTMIDAKQGITISGISNPDGTYSEQVPVGNYVVFAEPFNTIVTPSHLYFTSAQTTLATSVNFAATFFGGNTSPASVPVSANGTAAGTNIAVTKLASGQTSLAMPQIGFGKAGGSGDILNVNSIGSPISIASGQSLDIGFLGSGFDSSLTLSNVLVYGPGITATHIGVDPGVRGATLVRLTVTIAAQQNAGVATIFITKGTATSTLSLSGVLVITPPTPTFIPASLLSAASYRSPGQVSPGGIYGLYAPTGSPLNLGPANGVPSGNYLTYAGQQFLSTRLGGVTVTFDGVAAPLFYVSGGLINLQVPFEVAGKSSANIVVNFYGSASATVAVPVASEQPAFFTFTPQGTDSIVTNQDATLNSQTNPAARGSYVTAYGTGVGGVTGLITGESAALESTLNYNCSIGGANSAAYFAGYTPTAVGLSQFTFQIPAGIPAKTAQTLQCTDIATGLSTQSVTLYVGN